jgi:hypothetical protein
MALPFNTVWEVRSATGSPTNGGGFVPGGSGTDYSQQASPQYALTNGVTNGSSTINTASASSDMVNNIVYVAGGTGGITGTWKQVVSQVTGVSITVDSSSGLTSGTGVTINVGGALNSVKLANTNATADNMIWATGSETFTSTMSITLSQSGNGQIYGYTIQGYGTSRGDSGQYTITTSTNSIVLITQAGSQFILKNLNLSTTAGTPGDGILLGSAAIYFDVAIDSCTFTGFANGMNVGGFSNSAVPVLVSNSKFVSCTSAGITAASFTRLFACYFKSCGTSGITNSAGFHITTNAAMANGFDAIECTFALCENGITHESTAGNASFVGGFCHNCNFDTNTNNGYLGGSQGYVSMSFVNNIFYGNGSNAIDGGSNTSLTVIGIQYNNAFGSNGNNRLKFPAGIGDIALTANPWNSPSTGDYTLNSTSGGGAAVKGAGYQSTIM